jgi:hypothetical protein
MCQDKLMFVGFEVFTADACWFLAELISSTLKMEAICSSETSVDTQRTTWQYIPEVDTLQTYVRLMS